MMDRGRALVSAPFSPEYRASGVLLHVISLPSRHGIGDLGPSARAWVDRLADAGQSWWQSLPLGPTGYGNSPYQPLSTFAGNELLVSPDDLIEDGLLCPQDCAGSSFSTTAVDYAVVIPFKRRLLETAWGNFAAGRRADLRDAFDAFCEREAHWLDDYALFRALKAKCNGANYLEWPAELVERSPVALSTARQELAEAIARVCFAQFLLCRQGRRLKEYANSKGLRLIGDLPFYIAADSCDVWTDPELFKLDERHWPRFVAGVPPDYFSAQGQLWGNPVYDWDAIRRTGYRWCIDRFRALLAYVDMIRLDHFRGFAAAWHVPAGASTAQSGEWVPGPDAELFAAVATEFGALPFVAEDLGLITRDVLALRDRFQLPGMRVLQFAFDGKSDNPHLPGNFVSNTVVYTGTHDNPTTRGWFGELPDRQRQYLWSYLRRPAGDTVEVAAALMKLAWSSPAALAMAPLQDVLNLGNEARMNLPGRADGNWRWRCTNEMLAPTSFDWLRDLTRGSDRAPPRTNPDRNGATR
jgi:4-alpha-glucanotransferase